MLQNEALDILKMGHNVFLTGCAGSGKTYVLNKYIDFLRKKRVEIGITASTGIAATHLGGTTIHSFSGIGILDNLTKKDLERILKKSYLKKKLRRTSVLIIDEISMLSANQLDIVDVVLQEFRGTDEPFGGMQVILCGDFFQLPPIFSKEKTLYEDGKDFAYKGRAWKDLNLKVCYLTEQHRQKERNLLFVLESIRSNNITNEALNLLQGRYNAEIKSETEITKLYTHNINVDSINKRQLEKITEDSKFFHMKKRGFEKLTEVLEKNLLAPAELELKKGATVMFVKNNFEKGYVNGTLGRVEGFEDGSPIIKTTKGKYIKVLPERWSIIEEEQIKAEVEQLPLRLAWAITVHKSQGMTLDAAEIDLSRSFEPGMGYVALSRVCSLNGIRLMGLNETALMVNKDVIKIDKEFQKLSEKEVEKLNLTPKDKKEKVYITYNNTNSGVKNKDTKEETQKLISNGLSLKETAQKRGLKEETILSHLEESIKNGDCCDISHLNTLSEKKFKNIYEAFIKKDNKEMKLTPVKKILGNGYSYKDLRLVRLFLYKEKKENQLKK
jgi:hypothetical protein